MPHPAGVQTVIRAAESTENIPSARRVRDVTKRIHYLDPSAAPLTVLSKKGSRQSAFNPKFEWIEKDLPARWTAINNGAGYAAGDTSLVVDNGAYVSIGDIINVPRTGERMRVTNVVTNTLTVVRSVGPTAAAALLDNDDLQIIGNAYAEGVGAGVEKSHVETYPFNFTQIVRTPFGVTGTQNESENYTGPDKPRLRAEKSIEHMIDLERTILFGERDIDTSSTNNPIRYTGGFLFWATSNVKDFGGVMTEAEIEDWCEDLFHYTGGTDTRVVCAAPLPISVLDMLGVARLQLMPKDQVLGLTVRQFVTSHGTLMFTKHRLLEDGPTSAQGFGGYMLAVDPNRLRYRFMRNRDTKLRMDIQANDLDGWKDEYLTEVGWQVENPQLHGVGRGITG
ncbi:MAG TPA: DUF5309 family protein [Actinomycetota bacterium]|nr:DUF5309 family protein [Actinomycetota bacterium]